MAREFSAIIDRGGEGHYVAAVPALRPDLFRSARRCHYATFS